MSKLTWAEIDEAFEEYHRSEQAIREADTDFLGVAYHQREAAKERLDALVQRAKGKETEENKIIQFPMVRCQPPEDPEQNWPEFLFHLMERPLEIAVVLLAIGFIVVQAGLWLGWFK